MSDAASINEPSIYGKPSRQVEHVLTVVDAMIRCGGCNKLLAELAARPWIIKCGRCKRRNESPTS